MRVLPRRFSSNSISEISQELFSSSQLQIDSLIGSFSAQAGDLRSLLAMSAGSLGFSLTRALASPLFSTLFRSASFIRASSWGMGLVGEVATFQAVSDSSSWWDSRGFLQTMVDFSCLKLIGHTFRASSLIARHGISALGMVAGELSTESIGLREQSHQSFSQRFIQASVMSLAMEAGAELSHLATGGSLQALERNIEYSTASHPESQRSDSSMLSSESLAWEGPQGFFSRIETSDENRPLRMGAEASAVEKLNVIYETIEAAKDRLVLSRAEEPHEIFLNFLSREINLSPGESQLKNLGNRNILLLAASRTDVTRWRLHLTHILGHEAQLSSNASESFWEKKGLKIRVVLVDELMHLETSRLQRYLSRYSMLVLDKAWGMESFERLSGREQFAGILMAGRFFAETGMAIRNPRRFLLGFSRSPLEKVRAAIVQRQEIGNVEERVADFTNHYPIPGNLSEGEKEVLRKVRLGFYLHLGGRLKLLKGTQIETFLQYLHRGQMPRRALYRAGFLKVLEKLLLGTIEGEPREFLEKNIDIL